MLTMDNDRLLQEREREKANNSRSVFCKHLFPLFWPVYHIFGSFALFGGLASFCWHFDCESFARRTFTTPKFGHFPPQKKNICQGDNCHPQFFFFFFWRAFLGFFDLQLMEDIKDGKEEVLDEVVMEHIQ